MKSALPRVIAHDTVRVYAPTCIYCSSNTATYWQRLPTMKELLTPPLISGCGARAYCTHCRRDFFPVRQESFAAREPERLEAQLAELIAAFRSAS